MNKPDRRWALDDAWATLHTETGLVLAFQRVEDHTPPQWPDQSRPQQFHLDLGVADLDDAQQRGVELGATLLDAGETSRSWRGLR